MKHLEEKPTLSSCPSDLKLSDDDIDQKINETALSDLNHCLGHIRAGEEFPSPQITGTLHRQASEAGTTDVESASSDENSSSDVNSSKDSRLAVPGTVPRIETDHQTQSVRIFSLDLFDQLRPRPNNSPSKKRGRAKPMIQRHEVTQLKPDNDDGVQVSVQFHECIKQPHNLPIFSLSWSPLYPDRSLTATLNIRYVASCCGKHLTVYSLKEPETTPNDGLEYESLMLSYCYVDVDPQEDYYACEFAGWTHHQEMGLVGQKQNSNLDATEGHPQLLCVGGLQSIIKVIDIKHRRLVGTLKGHGAAIHDLKVSPTDEWLLLSASIDRSCRLWNLRLLQSGPVAVFGGHAGHTYYVNSISWDITGNRFVSGGMDNIINIWDLAGKVAEAIASSHQAADGFDENECIEHVFVSSLVSQFPIFSTKKVHIHCVDCVQFVGDLILSKSIENNVRLWFPKVEQKISALGNFLQPSSSDVVLLRTFDVENSEYWFVRFAVDPTQEILAAGNSSGTVYLFSIGAATSQPFRMLKIGKVATFRFLSFSPDGNVLLATTDSGSIYRWNLSR